MTDFYKFTIRSAVGFRLYCETMVANGHKKWLFDQFDTKLQADNVPAEVLLRTLIELEYFAERPVAIDAYADVLGSNYYNPLKLEPNAVKFLTSVHCESLKPLMSALHWTPEQFAEIYKTDDAGLWDFSLLNRYMNFSGDDGCDFGLPAGNLPFPINELLMSKNLQFHGDRRACSGYLTKLVVDKAYDGAMIAESDDPDGDIILLYITEAYSRNRKEDTFMRLKEAFSNPWMTWWMAVKLIRKYSIFLNYTEAEVQELSLCLLNNPMQKNRNQFLSGCD